MSLSPPCSNLNLGTKLKLFNPIIGILEKQRYAAFQFCIILFMLTSTKATVFLQSSKIIFHSICQAMLKNDRNGTDSLFL